MSNFDMLCTPIQNGIISKLGWKELTQVQEVAIPKIIIGRNAVILAPTAGGKTEAAFLPVLNQIFEEKITGMSIIYVSPIKALLNNQEERLKVLSSFVYSNVFKWHGDVEANEKIKSLKNPPNILMITPESLEVMLMSKKINKSELFKNIRFFIVDEVHSFAGTGRGTQLMALIERIRKFSDYDIQRIGLSATVGNPEIIAKWMQGSSKRNAVVIDPQRKSKGKLIEIKLVKQNENFEKEICKRIYGKKALFFSNSRNSAEGLKRCIENNGINTYVHHSSIDKRFREMAEKRFKIGTNICIIATSTLELGIDIGDLDIVLQLDSPNIVSSFLQRLGRTGRRRDKISHFVFFTTKKEKFVLAIAILNLAIKKWVENLYINRFAYDLMFHQIITMSLSEFGVDKDYVFDVLKNVYSFSGITRADYNYLVTYMERKKFIHIERNKMYIDAEIEKQFGRRNFMTLYSVFETNKEFSVKFRNRSIGTLDRWFVNALGESFQFILAGKCWQTDKIEYDKSIIYVVEAKTAMPPKWMSGEGFYSFELSQEILKILSTNENYAFLNNYEKSVLNDLRYEEKSFGVKVGKIIIKKIKNGYQFYTYAGNSVNYTIANALVLKIRNLYAKNITWKDFKLDYVDKDVKPSITEIINAINKIKGDDNYFENIYECLVEVVPNISLSKYQKYLPDNLRKKMVADYVYDIKKSKEYVKEITIDVF